ncbi:hypothetical protein AJ78_05279 [Emergomyces pasteurianus Ep9510]|uniref:Uncharacterized protein n=1 Tax=Emergomyces pasteurianus Ep9510 TaxID=1447872 RepID=A0A1J9PEC2_9EURO|nr:hypothetical protein AJ78_05279 [Emergomyces pasteurianus Ep9510]
MSLQGANFGYNHYRRLVHLVIRRLPTTESQNVETCNAVFGLIDTTPWLRNTSSFANSTEYRKYVDIADIVLKEELGEIHIGNPRFFNAYFRDIPQLTAVHKRCWRSARKGTAHFTLKHKEPSWKIDRRPLAQPSQPLQGSVAEGKLNVGLVNDLTATEDFKCIVQ